MVLFGILCLWRIFFFFVLSAFAGAVTVLYGWFLCCASESALFLSVTAATHKESEKNNQRHSQQQPSFSDQCRHLEFRPEQVFQRKRLANHLIRVHDPMMTDSCDVFCYMEHNCASYNLKKRSEAEGHRCELNNSTHEENENDMEENPGFVYRGTKVLLIAQNI